MSVLEDNSEVLTEKYLDIYSVPNSLLSFSTNGGEVDNLPLKNAFDRNFNSHWESKSYFSENSPIEVLVKFNSEVTIDRILYGCEKGIDRGFPTILKLSAKSGNQFVEIGQITNAPRTKMVEFKFEPVTTTEIKFDYVETNKTHRYNSTAREFIFLQPEEQELETLENIFADYNELTLKEGIDKAKLEELEKMASKYVNQDVLKERINRAFQILNGTLKFDPRREMSTSKTAQNVLAQNGDVAGRARELKMVWFGTNRQSTGITVNAGHELNVYVSAKPTDKLPKIVFTQFWGHWRSWKSSEFELKLGKNTFVADNFVVDDIYTHFDKEAGVVAGGPVYLVNPYTSKEQSDEVKVYFEGGELFPVYHLNGDEEKYKLELDEYTSRVENNRQHVINITELVSKNFIMTVRATTANPIYKTKSPQQNLLNWDEYIKEVMEFDGVQFDEKDPYYDERNQFLNCNIRLMQPTGAAYAYTEHVGIQPDWEEACIYTETFGWGFTHELGHMMDISERTVSECSNNMVSKYNETAMEKVATRGEFARTLAELTPDENRVESFFNLLMDPKDESSKRLNYLIWWLIESYDIGFWAKLENLYRFENITYSEGEQQMSATEKQVYLSSIALGIDLSYYFERWGYNLKAEDAIFNRNTASKAFQDRMAQALASNRFKNDKQPKIWYLDAKEYLIRKEGETSCYNSSIQPKIDYVAKTNNGYNIKFSSSCDKEQAHLGFEVLENGKVIGFTYDNAFTDTKKYDSNYTPSYKVVAYDRDLNPSATSESKSLSVQSDTCKLNNTMYNCISEAVIHANDGDTIYLLKDLFDSDIVIDKNLTITLDEGVSKDIKISSVGSGDLISVSPNTALTLKGTQEHKIILDGNEYKHNGALIKVGGSLTIEYATLTNNISSGNGGGIRLVNENATQSLQASHVEISHNSAVQGGGIFDNSGRMTARFNDCKILNNTAQYGGGATVLSGTVVYLTNCEFANNSAQYGGGYYGDSYTELNNCSIHDNAASLQGGGIYFSANVARRELYLKDNTSITQNTAQEGSAIYLGNGNINAIQVSIYSNGQTSTIARIANQEDLSIYLKAGIFKVNNAQSVSSLDGTIHLQDSAKIEVNNKMFEIKSSLKIVVENLQNGSVYLAANNFSFTTQDLEKILTAKGLAELSEGSSEIIARITQLKVTFIVDGKVYKEEYVDAGSEILLDEQCGIEGKYRTNFLWRTGCNK